MGVFELRDAVCEQSMNDDIDLEPSSLIDEIENELNDCYGEKATHLQIHLLIKRIYSQYRNAHIRAIKARIKDERDTWPQSFEATAYQDECNAIKRRIIEQIKNQCNEGNI